MASPTKRRQPIGPFHRSKPGLGHTNPRGSKPQGIHLTATCYGPPWDSMNGTGTTAGGTDLTDGKKAYIIAIPSGSPLHSGQHVFIRPNPFGYTGTFKVDDVCPGCASNQIDIYNWKGRASQLAWGKRNVTVTPTASGVAGVHTNESLLDKAGNAVGDAFSSLDFIARLFSPAFWLRVGKGILGLVLLVMGAQALSRALLGFDLSGPAGALIQALGGAEGAAARSAGTRGRMSYKVNKYRAKGSRVVANKTKVKPVDTDYGSEPPF